MSKSANIFARVEPDLKEQAEQVLAQLGVPMSNAITMFLRQIVMRQGIPFDVTIPQRKPLVFSELTAEELDAELEKGYQEAINGQVRSAEEVFAELEQRHGL